MSLIIKRTHASESVMEIVRSLGTYFDEDAYDEIESGCKNLKTYGAYTNKKMVGFIIFSHTNPQVVEVLFMGVSKNCQNHGVGSKLLNTGLRLVNKKKNYKLCQAKTIGVEDLDLKFAKTRKFYQKNGFLHLESIRPFPGWRKTNYVQVFIKCLDNH